MLKYLMFCAMLLGPNKALCMGTFEAYNATSKPITIRHLNELEIKPNQMISVKSVYKVRTAPKGTPSYADWTYRFERENASHFYTNIIFGLKQPVVIFETTEGNPDQLKAPYAIEYEAWQKLFGPAPAPAAPPAPMFSISSSSSAADEKEQKEGKASDVSAQATSTASTTAEEPRMTAGQTPQS